MKILQINTVVNWGSTGKIAEEIGNVLMFNGHESYIAYGRDFNPSKSVLLKVGSMKDVKLHVLKTRFDDKHGFGSKLPTRGLIDQIDKLKPDLIHLHNIHGYYLNIEILFNYLAKLSIPVVWTLHDCWPFTGHCIYFDYVACKKWETGCFACPQKRTYPSSLFMDSSKWNYEQKKFIFNSLSNLTLVPVSNWLANLVRKSFLQSHSIKVINNGIDLNCFKPVSTDRIKDKLDLRNKFVILGVASPWSERKGLADFIELNNYLLDNEVIILVGLNKTQIKRLPKNIIGIERTESVEELAELYSVANVFINPTWEDNFPTTNIESLACGTPVITYDTGGSVEIISSETGYVVEQGSIKKLLDKLRTIKKKGKRSYTSACLVRVRELYDKREKFTEYIRLYEEIIANNNKAQQVNKNEKH